MPRRHQPDRVLGGQVFRTADGYRALPQYGPVYPSWLIVQQVYSASITTLSPPKWDSTQPDAKQIMYFTDPFKIVSGCCWRSLGNFVAYHVEEEYGVIRHDTVKRHPIGNFPPDQFADRAYEGFEAKNPTFHTDGEIGRCADNAYAILLCPKCRRTYNPRNMSKLGKELFDSRPKRYPLMPP